MSETPERSTRKIPDPIRRLIRPLLALAILPLAPAQAAAIGTADRPGAEAAPGQSPRPVPKSAVLQAAETVSQISSISPASGTASGGTAAILRGNFFQPGATVRIGGAAAAVLAGGTGTILKVTAPALAPGTLNDVVVSNPDGSKGTLPAAWFADFTDVPGTNLSHDSVEQLARDLISSGCGGGMYCPTSVVTRAQMAVFILRAKFGPGYLPPPATGTVFADVSAGSFAAAWIEQLFAQGITGGCGTSPLRYCPSDAVALQQMAVFLLRGLHGTSYTPGAPAGIYTDLPPTSPFAPWGEQLAREGIYEGIGGGLFGTGLPVTRDTMAVLITRTFRQADVIRFLEQATWGPDDASIAAVQQIGIRAWLAQQFATPSSDWPSLALWPSSVPTGCNATCQRDNYTLYPLQNLFFVKAMYQPDQLRQRVVWALHQLLVTSGNDIRLPSWMAPYLRTLDRNAFGNFRTLLYEMTLTPAMGKYLDMATSTKFNPNENYGREINQLFSVGLNLLNPDATPISDGAGNPIATYDQTVVDGFAQVFTGWKIANASPGVPDYVSPMTFDASLHDMNTKTLLNGFTLPANQTGDQDLNQAIDNIFTHPNVGPFVCRHLIHQLVASNPSPGYIERAADVFNDDGTGTRGNLQAVVQAILLDPEARGKVKYDPVYGQLKQPVLLTTQILRAMRAKSFNFATNGGLPSDGYLDPQAQSMGQDVFKPPTVFNYFPADFVVPGTANVLGPEFGIFGATEAMRRANAMNTLIFTGIGVSANSPQGTRLDFSAWAPIAVSNPPAMVAEMSRVLMHNTMSAAMQAAIVNAVLAVPATNPTRRVQQGLYLVATSPQFQVKR